MKMISRIRRFSVCSSVLLFTIPCFLTVSCAEKTDREAAPPPDVDLSQAKEIFEKPDLAPAAPNPAGIVAVVEGENITQGDLNREINALMSRMRSQIPPEQMAQLRPQLLQQAMDTLITKTLLRQAVNKKNVEVTDANIEEAVAKIQGSMGSGMTLEGFLAQAGMTQEQFRQELTMDLRINKLLEAETDAITAPGDEDVQKYYDENKEQFQKAESVQASHILVAFDPSDDDAAKATKKAKAEQIREKLVAGEDFAKCASEDSDCPSKSRGGDLGTFAKGQMVPPFEEAAFSQPVGELGPIVETRFGYHIIKVASHEQAREIPLDEVRDKLADFLRAQQRQQAAQEYVKNLRDAAAITYPEATP